MLKSKDRAEQSKYESYLPNYKVIRVEKDTAETVSLPPMDTSKSKCN